MAVIATAVHALALILGGGGHAQPPLPPQERPRVLGTVLTISAADGLALESGAAGPIAEGAIVGGIESIDAIGPGDLVELVQDDNGLVVQIDVLPRLSDWRPLVEMIQGSGPIPRFWWEHDGQDFPDSLYSAEVSLPLSARASALSTTAAYAAADAEGPLLFIIIGDGDVVLWEQTLQPGETVDVTTPLGTGASVAFRCRRPDGSIPDHTHCVWASPKVLLREYGDIHIHPNTAADIVARLAEDLGQIDPGRTLVALPRVIGASQAGATMLQEDLLIAISARYPVAGATRIIAADEVSPALAQAAQAVEADTIAATELRYAPEGPMLTAILLNAATNETLARVETVLQP